MTDLLIRHLDPMLHARLKARAAAHRRSLGEEALDLLRVAIEQRDAKPKEHLVDVAARLFGDEHGVELSFPDRQETPDAGAPDFMGPDFAP